MHKTEKRLVPGQFSCDYKAESKLQLWNYVIRIVFIYSAKGIWYSFLSFSKLEELDSNVGNVCLFWMLMFEHAGIVKHIEKNSKGKEIWMISESLLSKKERKEGES